MKIKNLILSTVLIFVSSSLISFLLNKKESSNLIITKIDNPILTAKLSTTFPGIVFHVKIDIPPEDLCYITSIQILNNYNVVILLLNLSS